VTKYIKLKIGLIKTIQITMKINLKMFDGTQLVIKLQHNTQVITVEPSTFVIITHDLLWRSIALCLFKAFKCNSQWGHLDITIPISRLK
jgi:hypothetical protein